MTPFACLTDPPTARGNRFAGLQPFDLAEDSIVTSARMILRFGAEFVS
jgi:hypothetical protein